MWHANADLSGVDDPGRVAEIKKCEEPLVIDCGEEAEECVTFSTTPCYACGTRLAGSRHRAFTLR